MYLQYISIFPLVISTGYPGYTAVQALKCYRCGASFNDAMWKWTKELDSQMKTDRGIDGTTQTVRDKIKQIETAVRTGVPIPREYTDIPGALPYPWQYPCDDPFETSKRGKKDAYLWPCSPPIDNRSEVVCLKAHLDSPGGRNVFRGCAYYKQGTTNGTCMKTNNQTDCTCTTDYCNASPKVMILHLAYVALLALVQLFVPTCVVFLC